MAIGSDLGIKVSEADMLRVLEASEDTELELQLLFDRDERVE